MKILSSRTIKFFAAGSAIALAFSLPLQAASKPVEIKPIDAADVPTMMPSPNDDANAYEPGMVAGNPFAVLENFALKKPIVELAKPDPERLAIAEKVAGAIYADGTAQRMFTNMRTEMFQPVFDRFWTMKASELQDLFGIKPNKKMSKEKANETLGMVLGKKDPDAKARVEAFVTVYLDMLGQMSGAIEPDLRDAVARDFARRYDATQLTEMANFFATPTGAVLARDYWQHSMSLDIVQTSLMVWPKVMKAVPDFMQRLKNADSNLPPAPKGSPFAKPSYDSAEDYDSYMPPCAKDGDESDCTDADWDAAAAQMPTISTVPYAPPAAAAPYMPGAVEGETGNEPWFLEENWSDADLKKYDAANAAYRDHETAADALYGDVMDAEEAAIKAAREKYKKQGWKPAPAKE